MTIFPLNLEMAARSVVNYSVEEYMAMREAGFISDDQAAQFIASRMEPYRGTTFYMQYAQSSAGGTRVPYKLPMRGPADGQGNA